MLTTTLIVGEQATHYSTMQWIHGSLE